MDNGEYYSVIMNIHEKHPSLVNRNKLHLQSPEKHRHFAWVFAYCVVPNMPHSLFIYIVMDSDVRLRTVRMCVPFKKMAPKRMTFYEDCRLKKYESNQHTAVQV